MDSIGPQACGRVLKVLVPVFFLAGPAAAGAGSVGNDAAVAAADRPNVRLVDRWNPYIREASARFGIPEEWIGRVMRAESGGRTSLDGRPITSGAGAMGLMQLMPGTWAEMRVLHGLGPAPHDPRDNILAGTAYLRAMYDRFGYPGLFTAYSAGPARYAEHLATGRPLPAETVAYVAAVGSAPPRGVETLGKEPRQAGIFVALLNVGPHDGESRALPAASGALFVPLGKTSPANEWRLGHRSNLGVVSNMSRFCRSAGWKTGTAHSP